MQPNRPVMRYHGGKWLLAPWIISHFPEHRTYVESFGGAGSVLFRKPRSRAEVYNDRWGLVVDVFRVLRSKETATELERRIRLTPFARDEFECASFDRIAAEPDPIERARLAIFRSMAGFGSASVNGNYSTGFRCNSSRSGTTPAQDWANYPDQIEAFVARLSGVVIENKPASSVIDQHDSNETLFYMDPPYPHQSRNMRRGNANYFHEMTDEDHRQLADQLHHVEGMVVLSGYPGELYERELFSDWQKVQRKAYADGARPRAEVLWLNERAYEAMPHKDLFAGEGA